MRQSRNHCDTQQVRVKFSKLTYVSYFFLTCIDCALGKIIQSLRISTKNQTLAVDARKYVPKGDDFGRKNRNIFVPKFIKKIVVA